MTVKMCLTCNKPFSVRDSENYCTKICMEREIVELYADGGVILKNPSLHGCTWAFVAVGHNEIIIEEGAGVNTEMKTNNCSEMLAIVEGMKILPDGWDGTILSDSEVTLKRITGEYRKMKGLPDC